MNAELTSLLYLISKRKPVCQIEISTLVLFHPNKDFYVHKDDS